LIKVDEGVDCDIGTWVVKDPRDGTILTLGDGGDERHVLVASGHEFNSHVSPNGEGSTSVPIPGDMTSRAFVENVFRGRCNRYNVCKHKEGCGENKKRDESLYGKHFLLVFCPAGRGERVVEI